LPKILELVRRIRESSQIPLVLFSYYNPILQMGWRSLLRMPQCGVDGVLATDLSRKNR